jgi:hypothetical protein
MKYLQTRTVEIRNDMFSYIYLKALTENVVKRLFGRKNYSLFASEIFCQRLCFYVPICVTHSAFKVGSVKVKSLVVKLQMTSLDCTHHPLSPQKNQGSTFNKKKTMHIFTMSVHRSITEQMPGLVLSIRLRGEFFKKGLGANFAHTGKVRT